MKFILENSRHQSYTHRSSRLEQESAQISHRRLLQSRQSEASRSLPESTRESSSSVWSAHKASLSRSERQSTSANIAEGSWFMSHAERLSASCQEYRAFHARS